MSKNKIKLTAKDKDFLTMLNTEPVSTGGVVAKSNKARLTRLANRRLVEILFGNEAGKVNSKWLLSGNTAYWCPSSLGVAVLMEN